MSDPSSVERAGGLHSGGFYAFQDNLKLFSERPQLFRIIYIISVCYSAIALQAPQCQSPKHSVILNHRAWRGERDRRSRFTAADNGGNDREKTATVKKGVMEVRVDER